MHKGLKIFAKRLVITGTALSSALMAMALAAQNIEDGPETETNEIAMMDSLVPVDVKPFYQQIETRWVDSVFNSLTPKQRIAQLFMVDAYSNKGQDHVNEIKKLIEDYNIGGLIFMKGGPGRQLAHNNIYQKAAKTPLMIAMDAEWGLAMRLDSTINYPRQMMLGAIQDDELVYNLGRDIAKQCKRLGVHVNFAPVVDINNNPKNPVIGSRSFGEDKFNVARKGAAYVNGLQDEHVLACAKHFPGHGDTDSDSHKTLPIINQTKDRLDDLELYPFKELIKSDLGSMMIAHLYIPALDSTPNLASTLSPKVVDQLLRKDLGYDGLVFTDALNMQGVAKYHKPGDVDLKALLAGNDILLFSGDVPKAIEKIQQAIKDGLISQNEVDRRCKKVLATKQWMGLDDFELPSQKNLYEDLNSAEYELNHRKAVEAALTLVKNDKGLIPLQKLDTLRIASVAIGTGKKNTFQKRLSDYAEVTSFQISKSPTEAQAQSLISKLEPFDLVIVSVHNTSEYPWKKYGITKSGVKLVNDIMKSKEVILDLFANPYALGKFYGVERMPTVLVSYHDRPMIQDLSAQLIFGGITPKGKLPVSVLPMFPLGTGIVGDADPIRMKYTIPEELGIPREDLAGIDKIALDGVNKHAYPGCQILVAKEGKVIYHKTFGHHTYKKEREVQDSDIYDLASITKIGSSVISLMRLQDESKLDLNYNLCDYLPDMVDTSNMYQNMNLREMLAHQAGLVSWIPFYQKTLVRGHPMFEVYSLSKSEIYTNRVAENFYMNKHYEDSVYNRILNTPLRKSHDYKYSDLGYYFFKEIIERQSGQSLDEFTYNTFYKPMGMSTTGYHPRYKFDLDRIPPTELDLTYRKQLVHGDVHDPGAAMMGGVGGHAGLFSSANDLAKLMQMLISNGQYGGEQFIDPFTIKEYTDCQFCETNRRGAGFDKPVREGTGGPTCECVSLTSFGHSGFTGTLAWGDPDEEVVYIFLSNRVHPNADNRKLIKMGIRTNIMEEIYNAIEKNKPEEGS